MVVIPVGLHFLTELSTLRISIPQDLRPADNRRSVLLQLQELLKRHSGRLPQLDPIEGEYAQVENEPKITVTPNLFRLCIIPFSNGLV